MLMTFSEGKIIANQHELVIRIESAAKVTLQAQVDEDKLIGGANVITDNGSGIKWSISIDNQEQLKALSKEIRIAIKTS